MIYKTENKNFLASDQLYASGWRYVGKKAEYGYSLAEIDQQDKGKNVTYPKVIFTMNFAKSGFRQIFLIIIPVLLMCFMSLFTLSLDVAMHSGAIYRLSVGSISALLAYRFVIERLSPAVGYFTLSDYLYTYILIVTFFVFMLTNISLRIGQKSRAFNTFRVGVILFIHVSILLTIYYLLNFWQR